MWILGTYAAPVSAVNLILNTSAEAATCVNVTQLFRSATTVAMADWIALASAAAEKCAVSYYCAC